MKLTDTMTALEKQYATLKTDIDRVTAELRELNKRKGEIAAEAWKAHDRDFLLALKAGMLTGDVYVTRHAYSTLAVFEGECGDRDYPEMRGWITEVRSNGRKHNGVFVRYEDSHSQWIPVDRFRSGCRYSASKSDRTAIPYVQPPKWATR
jgi:hypothetical protein